METHFIKVCAFARTSMHVNIHNQPPIGMGPRLRARGTPTFSALAMRRSRLILALVTRVAPELATDRRCRTLHLRTELDSRKRAAVKVLNLVAFVLAQVCIAHVQFHLAAKL